MIVRGGHPVDGGALPCGAPPLPAPPPAPQGTPGGGRAFRQGLWHGWLLAVSAGVALAWVLLQVGLVAPPAGPLGDAVRWTQRNLGGSVAVFAALTCLFTLTLASLERRLAAAPVDVDAVAQADHLSELWASLFFGTGVIWTAIGMRGSLLYALGDPSQLAAQGALAVLERLVDGGILLALSTTIVGGVAGYLLRTWKALSVGRALKRVYAEEARAPASTIQRTLERIERGLRAHRGAAPGRVG